MRIFLGLVMLSLPVILGLIGVSGWAIAAVGIAACATTGWLYSEQARIFALPERESDPWQPTETRPMRPSPGQRNPPTDDRGTILRFPHVDGG